MKKSVLFISILFLFINSRAQTNSSDLLKCYQLNTDGTLKMDLSDFPGAIKDFNEAIILKPDYAEAFYNRGVSKEKLKDYKGAIEDYDKAISLNPDYIEALHHRADIKYLLKDKEGACIDWNRAGKLGDYDAVLSYNENCM